MQNSQSLPDDFIQYCQTITAKRPKVVITHILKYGFITTEELKDTYGYNHPPRAARDVRECGIPLETFRVMGSDGRKIAAYRFGDISKTQFTRLSGRTGLSKQIKKILIDRHGCKCFIYLEKMNERDLHIDHRVPFEVGGEPDSSPENFMLLSPSANRAKSWSCENCKNWSQFKSTSICLSCYWAYPEQYEHVAMQAIRRIDLLWEGDDVEVYEALRKKASSMAKEVPEFVKDIIEREIKRNNSE